MNKNIYDGQGRLVGTQYSAEDGRVYGRCERPVAMYNDKANYTTSADDH